MLIERTIARRWQHAVAPLFARAQRFAERAAIADKHGVHTYGDLARASRRLAARLPTSASRVAFLCGNDASYALVQWATWRRAAVAVPLAKSHPLAELEYVIADSQANVVVSSEPIYHDRVGPLCEKLGVAHVRVEKEWMMPVAETMETKEEEEDGGVTFPASQGAQLLYTSGTTGRPKGVLATHGNIEASVNALTKAWGFSSRDRQLHVLPLHHVHGIVNGLLCPLWCGATCLMLPEFDEEKVWSALIGDEAGLNVNLFTAVPTIYVKLIKHYEDAQYSAGEKERIRHRVKENIRLMMSGSAPLPTPIMKKWHDITGHWLLERYGMTEIGMALSNPLNGERKPGTVGTPLPGVKVRITREKDGSVMVEGNETLSTIYADSDSDEGGSLEVKGPAVFTEYWNRPEATAEAFTDDGWFKTGDTACYKDGVYQILGRTSVDIIKSGGYKISALDIERVFLSHPDIADCAVIGLPDDVWGQAVTAIVVTKREIDLPGLREWARDHLASYALPRNVLQMKALPRNAMGKVNKKDLAKVCSTSASDNKNLLVNSYFHDLVFPSR